MENTVKQRLIEYLKLKNISFSEFGRTIGASNAYVTSMRKSIPDDKVKSIALNYPDLNIEWLLYNKGGMLKGGDASESDINTDKNLATGKVIPFYDADTAAGNGYIVNMDAARRVGMIEIGSLLKDSESALRVYGNSMTPNYPAGCIVGVKKHRDSFIEPGTVYVIETEDNRYIKRLYYNATKDAFRCISDNSMKHEEGSMKGEFYYPEFEIPFTEVRRLYRVTGVIKRNIV